MKEGIHPNYREVLFVDLSNGFKFVTRSCVNTKETETFEGKDYPCSSWTPRPSRTPSTPARKVGGQHGRPCGRFRNRFGKK